VKYLRYPYNIIMQHRSEIGMYSSGQFIDFIPSEYNFSPRETDVKTFTDDKTAERIEIERTVVDRAAMDRTDYDDKKITNRVDERITNREEIATHFASIDDKFKNINWLYVVLIVLILLNILSYVIRLQVKLFQAETNAKIMELIYHRQAPPAHVH